MTAAPQTVAAATRPARRKAARLSPSQWVAMAMLAVMVGMMAITPFLPLYDPFTQDLPHGLLPPLSPGHLLGTDVLGRDLLSRLALAGRTSIFVAVGALTLNIVVGVALGLVAGYFGRLSDAVIMGVADLRLSIPIMMLIVMVVAVVGPGQLTLVVVLGLTYWVGYTRMARIIALSLREREFVLAARTFGASHLWILRKHLFPQVIPQLAILGSLDLGSLIILESGLSYLGLGVQAPTPSWGGMISEGQDFLQITPWMTILPGAAIWLLVGGVTILSQRLTSEGKGRPRPSARRAAK